MLRYNLLTFLCMATVIAYLQRSALGVPSKQIESELQISSQDMGLVWLAWYVAYALFQLPAGIVAERLGSKTSLIFFAVAWSALTALTGQADGFLSLCVVWGLMGLAQAGIFVCATKAIGATFPRTEQAIASGALACAMAGGAALSQYVTGQLFGPLTWQDILFWYAVPGLVWAACFAIAVPRPESSGAKPPVPHHDGNEPQCHTPPAAPTPWFRLLTNRDMLILSLQQFLRAGATALFFTWFPRYLQETKGVSVASSGSLATWPLLAGMVGGLVGGTVSDRLLRRTGNLRLSRQGLAAVGTAICTFVSLAAYWVESANGAVLLISIAALCGYSSGVSAYAIAIEMGGKRVAPVFGTMNMAGNIGAGIFPFAVGQLVDGTGNWNATLLLFAGMFAGATVCWGLLNPQGTLFEEK